MARRERRLKQPKGKSAWDRINPYVNWALGPGRSQYYIPGRQEEGKERMPLLLQLRGDDAQDFLDGVFIEGEARRKRWQDSFRIVCRPKSKTSSVWVSTMATEEIVTKVASAEARRSVEGVSLGRPLDTRALPSSKKPSKAKIRRAAPKRAAGLGSSKPLALTLNSPPVVMGIIDDGIAFINERFRKIVSGNIESRVAHWWLQDGPSSPTNFPFTLPPPQSVSYGCELSNSQIDALLAACTSPAGVVDEDLFYRSAHLIDFSNAVVVNHQSAAWRASHGTHVMDLACGFDPYPPVHDRPIICVQLPTRVTADEYPGTLYPAIIDGIAYIVDRAQALAPSYGVLSLPVVINVSYGLLADSHDGTGGLEAFIDAKIQECKNLGFDLRVVLPAGNSYLARTHGQISFTSAGPEILRWRIQPDDRTPSFLEVWLPDPFPTASRVTLKLTSPAGTSWTINELPFSTVSFPYGQISSGAWPVVSPQRTRFTIMLQPTAQPDPNVPIAQLAPAGTWQIELRNTGGLTATPKDMVHAWVQRDDQVYGFPLRGRQSFLDDPAYIRFDNAGRDEERDIAVTSPTPVRRESTINSIATGQKAIVMGGYLNKEKLPAKYSAAGARTGMPVLPSPPPVPLPNPTFLTTPRWADAMAVSEDSRVHTGVLAAGSHSGSIVALGGTSVAAPQVARWVADNLAGAGAGDRLAVQILASTGIPLPQPERSGEGGISQTNIPPIVKLNRFEP
jgi:hypothetical protein